MESVFAELLSADLPPLKDDRLTTVFETAADPSRSGLR
jgi:hypothetical protein